MNDKKSVKMHAVDLANEIRGFCMSQVDLWRQIPWIAADAHGHDGDARRFIRACSSGVWLVHAPTATGQVHAYVDLLTGELIDSTLFHRDCERVPISDLAVLPFAMVLDSLDASSVLHELRLMMDKPYPPGVDPEAAQKWRDHLRSYYNLKPIYDGTAKRSFD